jgi:hypothetical protein
MNKINKDLFYWTAWLILVILWNYVYPSALPLYDVLVAVGLSLIFILIKKIK